VSAFAHAPYLPGRPEPTRSALGLAIPLVHALGDEYGRLFGRRYAVLDTWGMAEAELAIVALGTVAGAVRAVLGELRGQGMRVGLVRLRLFRPFPGHELARALRQVRGVAVLERSLSRGAADGAGAGPLHLETAAALAATRALPPPLLGFVCGARIPEPGYVAQVVAELEEAASIGRREVAAHSLGPGS
jgi:pyruvate ferredoxin oxidoreductase alpha subunit